MLSLIAVLVCQAASAARSTAPPSSSPPGVVLSVSVERRVEYVRYHFTDASSFDTTALVPHFFEQRYDASNTWISVAADYRLAGAAARTEVALTPRVTTAGSDLDTFFDPSGDVIVSGTDGLVSLGSVALSERLGITTWRGWTLGVTVGYRRSRADFPPDVVIVTHTLPPSTTRTLTSDPETTISQVVESGFIGDARWRLGGAWHLSVSLDALPITRAGLTVSLPGKYPGDDTTAAAYAFGARGQLAIERAFRRVTAGVGVAFGGAWSYESLSAYGTHAAGLTVYVRTN
ncbi:MAG TPA: hypothetical protein VIX35_05065 [Vicinamibacterales bacterium]